MPNQSGARIIYMGNKNILNIRLNSDTYLFNNHILKLEYYEFFRVAV